MSTSTKVRNFVLFREKPWNSMYFRHKELAMFVSRQLEAENIVGGIVQSGAPLYDGWYFFCFKPKNS